MRDSIEYEWFTHYEQWPWNTVYFQIRYNIKLLCYVGLDLYSELLKHHHDDKDNVLTRFESMESIQLDQARLQNKFVS